MGRNRSTGFALQPHQEENRGEREKAPRARSGRAARTRYARTLVQELEVRRWSCGACRRRFSRVTRNRPPEGASPIYGRAARMGRPCRVSRTKVVRPRRRASDSRLHERAADRPAVVPPVDLRPLITSAPMAAVDLPRQVELHGADEWRHRRARDPETAATAAEALRPRSPSTRRPPSRRAGAGSRPTRRHPPTREQARRARLGRTAAARSVAARPVPVRPGHRSRARADRGGCHRAARLATQSPRVNRRAGGGCRLGATGRP